MVISIHGISIRETPAPTAETLRALYKSPAILVVPSGSPYLYQVFLRSTHFLTIDAGVSVASDLTSLSSDMDLDRLDDCVVGPQVWVRTGDREHLVQESIHAILTEFLSHLTPDPP